MKATVEINGKVMGDLDELMAKPTEELTDAMRQMITGRPAAAMVQLGFDYSQIDEGVRDEVRDAAQKIRAYSESLKGSIIAIGKRLIQVKGMLPDGQFGGWIDAEFQLSQRMAQNLMNVARVYGDRPGEIISPLSDTVLYLLAAPSTPDEAREEVEQAAANGQKVTVEFAKEAVRKAKPVSPSLSPARVIENMIEEWLGNAIGERGIPTPDSVLDMLVMQTTEPHKPGSWLVMLSQWLSERAVMFDADSLARAIDAVRGRRRVAARQAQARTVYVEPAEPTPAAQGDIGGVANKLLARNVAIIGAAIVEPSPTPDPEEAAAIAEVEAEREQEDAERLAREAERIEDEDDHYTARGGILSRMWIMNTLISDDPAHAYYASALSGATADDLREALASLSTEDKHCAARLSALMEALDVLEPPALVTVTLPRKTAEMLCDAAARLDIRCLTLVEQSALEDVLTSALAEAVTA